MNAFYGKLNVMIIYYTYLLLLQIEYQKDFRSSLRDFHQVSDSVAQQQMAHASGLASGAGYRTAPHEVPGVGQAEPQGSLIIICTQYGIIKSNKVFLNPTKYFYWIYCISIMRYVCRELFLFYLHFMLIVIRV